MASASSRIINLKPLKANNKNKDICWFVLPVEDCSGGGEVEDLTPDNADTSVVTGIELQNHGVEQLGGVELLGAGQDGAGLPSAGGAIHQQVGQLVILDEGADGLDDVLVRDQLI